MMMMMMMMIIIININSVISYLMVRSLATVKKLSMELSEESTKIGLTSGLHFCL